VLRGTKQNKTNRSSLPKKGLYSDAVKSKRYPAARSPKVQEVPPVVKKVNRPERARHCCGVRAELVSGKFSTATFPGDVVQKIKPIDFAFSGETLFYAPSVRDNTFFEVHKDKEVRRTFWANSKIFEYQNNLVQLPAGLKVYLVMPKVAGTSRCVRLRLDGRSWWKRGDITALASAFDRAVNKLSIVAGAPQFKSGRISRKRRRNHRGRGSLRRRRERRKEVVAKLKAISERDQAATQTAAAAIYEQESVKITKDTFKAGCDYLGDFITMNGPYFMKEVPEDHLPGSHPSVIEARKNLVSFIEKNYVRPVSLPKHNLRSRHSFLISRNSRWNPSFLTLNDSGRLSVVYTSGDSQEVIPLLHPGNLDSYFNEVESLSVVTSTVKFCTYKKLTPSLY